MTAGEPAPEPEPDGLAAFLAEFTGEGLVFGSVGEMMQAADAARVIGEAEMAMSGVCAVCIIHGDAETADDAYLIWTALPKLAEGAMAEHGAVFGGSLGGNDYTVRKFAGPGAQAAADAFAAAAGALGRRTGRIYQIEGRQYGWKITRDAYPEF